jgi:hypothetical protein
VTKRFCDDVKLTFFKFDVQRSAAISALRAIDEGKVFPAQAFD